jgi:hypothetical protein
MTEALVVLLVVAVALYLLNTYLPGPATAKTIVNIVVVLLTLVWLIEGFAPHWRAAGVG